MSKISGKTALITGASRGIGKAILFALGKAGCTVIGTATSKSGAQAITKTIEQAGFTGCGMVLNVNSEDNIEKVFTEIKQNYNPIEILVNNAGITDDNLLMRMKAEQWDNVINTNLNSVYRLCKASSRDMMKARFGRIINIASVVGVMGNVGQTNYAAAKAGLIGFSKSLAREIGSRGITVNVIAPGFISTDMTDNLPDTQKQALIDNVPLASLGKPEDIAEAVVFLAQADYITGETLHINGGMYMI
ncbi:3-oxoacyl-ACP reductase FabG [Suttonella ornithocola]|uniref:3-oxoacyl-[acyl-carrier-protein] reductase n=1 Tax=Suttonella ornithocola TaxID=279832 RepID=A0A380N097_9GAMM|nr:3-oxoacyl-ACP reductase FabG [Suttonella ornithocola]SUO97948.1 3-oxoacyl-[acyl-carrier-protein] reductase FabG [Suttonella ornithocola]